MVRFPSLFTVAALRSLMRIKPRRLLRVPSAHVIELSEERASVQVDGLFCAICAHRVSTSLNKLQGVSAVTCDLDTATATLRLEGPVTEAELKQAVLDAVTAMPVRRAVDRLAARFIRSSTPERHSAW